MSKGKGNGPKTVNLKGKSEVKVSTSEPTLTIEDKYKEFVTDYTNIRPKFKYFTQQLEAILARLLKEENFKFHKLEARTKKIDSFEKKLRKEGKYKDPLNEMWDLSALRIIVNYTDEVPKVAEILKREFHEEDHEEKHLPEKQDPKHFGYVSDHYNLKLKEDGEPQFSDWPAYKDTVFEVQIRTVLQHGWASISHALDYKEESDVPIPVRRKLHRLSGLLELADEQFLEIRDTVQETKKSISKIYNIQSTGDTMQAVGSVSPKIQELIEVAYNVTRHKSDDGHQHLIIDLPIDSLTLKSWTELSVTFKKHLKTAHKLGITVPDHYKAVEKYGPVIEERDNKFFSATVKECDRLGIKTIGSLTKTLEYDSSVFLQKIYSSLTEKIGFKSMNILRGELLYLLVVKARNTDFHVPDLFPVLGIELAELYADAFEIV